MRAANTICNQFRTHQATNDPTAYFLTSWLAYHKILSEFSHIPEHSYNEYTIPELPIEDPKNHVVSTPFYFILTKFEDNNSPR